MTSAQIADAQRLSSEWKAGFTPVTAATGEARSIDEPKARRRTGNLSGDGEKPLLPRPPSNNEEPPRPPAAIAQLASAEAIDEPKAGRRTGNLSGDGEKPLLPRPPSNNEEPPKPPAAIAQLASAEAADPMDRMRAYAASGAGPEEAAAEAPKPASGKSHRRNDISNDPQ